MSAPDWETPGEVEREPGEDSAGESTFQSLPFSRGIDLHHLEMSCSFRGCPGPTWSLASVEDFQEAGDPMLVAVAEGSKQEMLPQLKWGWGRQVMQGQAATAASEAQKLLLLSEKRETSLEVLIRWQQRTMRRGGREECSASWILASEGEGCPKGKFVFTEMKYFAIQQKDCVRKERGGGSRQICSPCPDFGGIFWESQ